MTISVIIPCYNAGPYVTETLRSIAGQVYAALEIIVVDDGSTDDSIQQINTSGVPVKLIQTDHVNAASARNVGIFAAKGDWVAFLDADDIWYPHHLQSAVQMLSGGSDVAYRTIYDELLMDGSVRPCRGTSKGLISEKVCGKTHTDALELELRDFPFSHSGMVYNRTRTLRAGLFDPAQIKRHDVDLWLRLVHGHTWCYDPAPGLRYRLGRPGSIGENAVDAERWYLRAMQKNHALYDMPIMKEQLQRHAKHALSLAFNDGTHEEYARAKELGWPYLPRSYRAFYRSVRPIAPLARVGIRLKRALFSR